MPHTIIQPLNLQFNVFYFWLNYVERISFAESLPYALCMGGHTIDNGHKGLMPVITIHRFLILIVPLHGRGGGGGDGHGPGPFGQIHGAYPGSLHAGPPQHLSAPALAEHLCRFHQSCAALGAQPKPFPG